MSRKKNFKIKNTFTFVIVLIVFIVAVVLYLQNSGFDFNFSSSSPKKQITAGTATGVMKIHFIDVGQGDCTFIEFPDGNNMLIDSGNRGNGDTITEYLTELGYSQINLLMATHSDADHIGSMDVIFQNFKVDYCYRPATYYSGDNKSEFSNSFNVKPKSSNAYTCIYETYYNFLNALKNEGCEWEYFNCDSDFYSDFSVDDAQLQYSMDFLTPLEKTPNVAYEDSNDYSAISILTYGSFDIIFTGDAHELVEMEVLNNYPAESYKDVEVLKVGHHGSESSTCDAFVKAFKPEYAVILCGDNNTYKHPRQKTLDTLYNNGVIPFRTDKQGSIILTVSANGDYEFDTEKTYDFEKLYDGKDTEMQTAN